MKFLNIIMVLLIISLAAFGILLSGCASSGAGSEYGPEIGKLAPDFTLTGLDGKEVALSDLRGKAVLLNFWASWCGPCRIEMPFFQEIYEKWTTTELVLLAVNLQEDPAKVREFVESGGYSFPILLTTGNEVPLAYNIRGIPATFFIDADGVIRDIKVGAFLGIGDIESRLVKIMP